MKMILAAFAALGFACSGNLAQAGDAPTGPRGKVVPFTTFHVEMEMRFWEFDTSNRMIAAPTEEELLALFANPEMPPTDDLLRIPRPITLERSDSERWSGWHIFDVVDIEGVSVEIFIGCVPAVADGQKAGLRLVFAAHLRQYQELHDDPLGMDPAVFMYRQAVVNGEYYPQVCEERTAANQQ